MSKVATQLREFAAGYENVNAVHPNRYRHVWFVFIREHVLLYPVTQLETTVNQINTLMLQSSLASSTIKTLNEAGIIASELQNILPVVSILQEIRNRIINTFRARHTREVTRILDFLWFVDSTYRDAPVLRGTATPWKTELLWSRESYETGRRLDGNTHQTTAICSSPEEWELLPGRVQTGQLIWRCGTFVPFFVDAHSLENFLDNQVAVPYSGNMHEQREGLETGRTPEAMEFSRMRIPFFQAKASPLNPSSKKRSPEQMEQGLGSGAADSKTRMKKRRRMWIYGPGV